MSPRIPRRAALALTGAALAAPALAQGTFPNRPVTLVIPYPPGGTIDISAVPSRPASRPPSARASLSRTAAAPPATSAPSASPAPRPTATPWR